MGREKAATIPLSVTSFKFNSFFLDNFFLVIKKTPENRISKLNAFETVAGKKYKMQTSHYWCNKVALAIGGASRKRMG